MGGLCWGMFCGLTGGFVFLVARICTLCLQDLDCCWVGLLAWVCCLFLFPVVGLIDVEILLRLVFIDALFAVYAGVECLWSVC